MYVNGPDDQNASPTDHPKAVTYTCDFYGQQNGTSTALPVGNQIRTGSGGGGVINALMSISTNVLYSVWTFIHGGMLLSGTWKTTALVSRWESMPANNLWRDDGRDPSPKLAE